MCLFPGELPSSLVKQSQGCLFPSPWSFENRCICISSPPLPHRYLRDPHHFILVVHQDHHFDVHLAACLRCKSGSCEVQGRLLSSELLFTQTFASSSSRLSCSFAKEGDSPLLSLTHSSHFHSPCIEHPIQTLDTGCENILTVFLKPLLRVKNSNFCRQDDLNQPLLLQ